MQRTLFARLLLQDARVILLDEPFTALDANTTAEDLVDLVRRHGASYWCWPCCTTDPVRAALPGNPADGPPGRRLGPHPRGAGSENLLKARHMGEAW